MERAEPSRCDSLYRGGVIGVVFARSGLWLTSLPLVLRTLYAEYGGRCMVGGWVVLVRWVLVRLEVLSIPRG